ncbi:hypothetical protein [Streptomyces sp. NPDC046909]|uniref:hypothetical protein n=1 Tax=Streptomyces sp. NPDC046909 TaxID=3155617 RepID=UPI0033C49ACC
MQRTIGVGRGAADLARVAGVGAETVELTGDKAQDAKAIAAALDGRSPELVLDYLWGTPAESAFEALHSIPGAAPTNYVEIGSFPMGRYLVQGMAYLQVLADGKITVDATTYPLEQCTDAWNAGPGPRAVLTAG